MGQYNSKHPLMPDSELRDVREFHHKFDLGVGVPVTTFVSEQAIDRYRFLDEELGELYVAIQKNDLAGIADALIDIVYVAKGTAVMMGLPWEALWADVQRANMTKVKDHSKCVDGHKAGMVKPDGWEGPKTSSILAVLWSSGGSDGQV